MKIAMRVWHDMGVAVESRALTWKSAIGWFGWALAFAFIFLIGIVIVFVNAFPQNQPIWDNNPVAVGATVIGVSVVAFYITKWWRYAVVHKDEIKARRAEKAGRELTKDEPVTRLGLAGAGAFMTGLGSLGPIGLYMFLTGQWTTKATGWKLILLTFGYPIGAWMLAGMMMAGIYMLWCAAIGKIPEEGATDRIYEKWNMLGLWLEGIVIVIGVGLWLFGGLADALGSMSKGTLLIAGLLFMILLALWQISSQLRQRR